VLIAVAVPMLQQQLRLTSVVERRPVLSVTGDVSGLLPGRPGRLVLTVHNGGTSAAVVHRLTTSVRSQAPGCTLTVGTWGGSLTVPAGGAVSRAVVVQAAGARCASAAWDLDYTAG
jgi:hypothetical protein